MLQRNPYTPAVLPSAPKSPRRLVKGIVLAGVHDWGGCALDALLPRPLAPVAGRPLIRYAVEWLRSAGVSELTICSNLPARRLVDALGDASDGVTFYQDVMPRGPAGCLFDAWLGSEADAGVLVDGSTIPECDLPALLGEHESGDAALTVVVREDSGHVRATDFQPPAGIYVASPSVLEHVAESGYVDLKEGLIPVLYDRGYRMTTYGTAGTCPRVTGVASYLAANDWVLERNWTCPEGLDGFEVAAEGSRIHPTSQVHRGARLAGPVQVGAGSEISDGVTLVGPVCIGSDVRIHDGAVICRSVLWDSCEVGAEAHLDRCLVAQGAVIRRGARAVGAVLAPGCAEVERPGRRKTGTQSVPR